ncbi:MAG: pyridoxal-phosphate dependent enzyme, partial [Pseudomonadota bacterium]
MREVVSPTPLQANALLSQRYSANILLKREDLTAVRSYKLRGAYNFFRKALSATSETTPEHSASANGAHPTPRFVCASAGNHAQGFAFACSHFGVDGTIFMPVTTPEQKVAKTREFGGDRITIELEGDIFDQCYQAAIARAADTGAILVPPFDHPDVIEGQASVALEVLAQAPSPIDVLVLPVGGGGLSAGMAPVLAAHSPETKIILVEPAGAPSLRQSLREGRRVRLDAVNTFVDGAAVAEIGALNFEMLRTYDPNEMVIVDEDHLCGTIIEMLNSEGIVLEPAGALALHALNAIPSSTLAGKTVVCVTTGGNFDFERLPE